MMSFVHVERDMSERRDLKKKSLKPTKSDGFFLCSFEAFSNEEKLVFESWNFRSLSRV